MAAILFHGTARTQWPNPGKRQTSVPGGGSTKINFDGLQFAALIRTCEPSSRTAFFLNAVAPRRLADDKRERAERLALVMELKNSAN
jgi:hypothetical protein